VATTDVSPRHCDDAEADSEALLSQAHDAPTPGKRILLAPPAYDQAIKASHIFNLLDARGVISVTERQAYIGRVRALSKQCADAFVQTRAGGFVEAAE
jgi:glycyl-tRNA synthetase alpha chain